MEKDLNTIGKRLGVTREIRNIQAKEVHEKTGISLGNLHSLEHDNPLRLKLIKLSKFMGYLRMDFIWDTTYKDESKVIAFRFLFQSACGYFRE